MLNAKFGKASINYNAIRSMTQHVKSNHLYILVNNLRLVTTDEKVLLFVLIDLEVYISQTESRVFSPIQSQYSVLNRGTTRLRVDLANPKCFSETSRTSIYILLL